MNESHDRNDLRSILDNIIDLSTTYKISHATKREQKKSLKACFETFMTKDNNDRINNMEKSPFYRLS